MSFVRCPKCGGAVVRRSHRKLHERLLLLFFAFRCESEGCSFRFLRPRWMKIATGKELKVIKAKAAAAGSPTEKHVENVEPKPRMKA